VRGDQGDFGAAIADFDQAIKLDPRNVVAWTNRCGALFRKGALDAALVDCNRALKLEARDAYAWNNRGMVRLEKASWLARSPTSTGPSGWPRNRQTSSTIEEERGY